MNYFYLISVIGSRGVALVTVVILSHLLSPGEFGVYALAATNALLTQIVLGSWIATSATKHVSLGGSEPDPVTISTLAAAMAGYALLMGLLALAYAVFPFAATPPAQVAIVLGWSVAIMFHDTTLASNNGLGRDRSYAVLSLTRNLLGAFLSIFLVLRGSGAIGAMLGQVVGALLPTLILGSSIRIWRKARLSRASKALMLRLMKFGAAGTLALGLYVLFNATTRNCAALFLGEAGAGYLSLATDLFIGPLALLGAAYSLSKFPSLYLVEAEGSEAQKREEISDFLHMNLYIALPYGIAGAILAPEIASAVVSASSRPAIAAVAGAAAIQSAMMLMLTSISTILLIFNRRRALIPAVLGTSALNFILLAVALSFGASLVAVAWLSTLVLSFSVVVLVWLGVARRMLRLRPGPLAKMGLAAAIMGGAVWLYARVLVPGEPFGAILIGVIVYLGLTALMGVQHVRELAPRRRQASVDMTSIATPLD